MPHDPQKYVYDALEATKLIETFTDSKSFADYAADPLLRSGVERQLITVGEALNQLAQRAPDVAAHIGDHRRIVAFRNIIVHGYDIVESETVWSIVQSHIPPLARQLTTLLDALDAGEE